MPAVGHSGSWCRSRDSCLSVLWGWLACFLWPRCWSRHRTKPLPLAPRPPYSQLTINLVALIVAFVAAITNGETPLNVLQLLWVNLIMDSLAALGELG